MSGMPPPPPRPGSRFRPAPAPGIDERLASLIDATAELRGPLSTIPDGRQAQAGEADARETDAASPVGWQEYFDSATDVAMPARGATFRVYAAGSAGPVLLCLHGGGYTGLTWAVMAARLKGRCRILAPDLRGHGETSTANDADLSIDTLTQDVVALWQTLLGAERPATVLVGHSMGGAVATRAAASLEPAGLVMVDVVEGTALAALPHMRTVLQNRPSSFPTLTAALGWAQHSGLCRSAEAAAVSLPSQLRRERAVSRERWVWRTQLAPSARFWEGWYRGLSAAFLEVRAPKLLLLAGTDRLDRALTIGQMQGKFQLSVLPKAGHAVHEDESEKTADVILTFLQRQRVGQAVPLPRLAAAPSQ